MLICHQGSEQWKYTNNKNKASNSLDGWIKGILFVPLGFCNHLVRKSPTSFHSEHKNSCSVRTLETDRFGAIENNIVMTKSQGGSCKVMQVKQDPKLRTSQLCSICHLNMKDGAKTLLWGCFLLRRSWLELMKLNVENAYKT